MSVSFLPEWKQLLLEKKRREEEERERREKLEEEKFASMPAWKRGIIQRRKAKQETLGDREKERDICLMQVDVKSPSDCLSDTDSSVTVNLGSEPSLSPDPGQCLDADPRSLSEVSVETIVPVHENPFIRTQSAWRKGRDADVGNEPEVKDREKEKSSPKGQDGEPGKGRDIEQKIERFRDLSEGQDKERSRDRSQGRENSREGWEKEKSLWKESVRDAVREREFLKVRKDKEENETDPQSGSFSPFMRTIRADNIIIIEQDRKGSDDKRRRWREVEKERPEEDHQGKRGMKMDLREILAGGGSVTEIRASEVLIIKPSACPEERNTGGKGGEDEEMKCSMDIKRECMGRELRTDMSWLREKENETVKERPWSQAAVIKEDRQDSSDDNVFVEKGGRVSQLLSKFGEHPKPPSRSKSSDNFLQPGSRKYSGDQDDQEPEEKKIEGKNVVIKGVPKRSFSFSDRVVGAKENGLDDEGYNEKKTPKRAHSEKNVALWLGLGKETTAKIKLGCTRLLDKGRFGKHVKNVNEKEGHMQRRNEAEMCISIQSRSDVKKVEPVDKRAAEKLGDADGDAGFTIASVKNTDGISFARRVPIRQDGKARPETEMKRLTGEKRLERELSVEKNPEPQEQIESQFYDRKMSDFCYGEGFENSIPAETMQNYVMAVSADAASPSHAAESQYNHESAFTECSSLLCAVSDRPRDPHRGPEWSNAAPYITNAVLSQQTQDLISKIEKIGDTAVYNNKKGEEVYKPAQEKTKECKQEGHYSNGSSESLINDITTTSPKRVTTMGISPGPLEIQIPRTVFYVAEEMVERKKTRCQSVEGQNWEGGQRLEKRDSWRIGKPLSRIESLREKIRQRELERLKQRETQDGDGGGAAEGNDTQSARDRHDERGTEIEKEWEAAAHMQKRLVETDTGQEETEIQTFMAAFDVTQEVSLLKTCPQLPVSVSDAQAVRGEEVTSGYRTATSEVVSDISQIPEYEDEPLKHVEEYLKRNRGQHEDREEDRGEEEKELSEEEVGEYTSPLDPTQSLSPSPPHPNSLAAMSRIYNLESVGSRSGLCLRERTVDISSVHLVKVKPFISNAQQGDNKTVTGEDNSGVQTIRRQIEQFQLKEQEPLKSYASPNTSLKSKETKGQQNLRGLLKHQVKDDVKTQEKDQETPESNSKLSPQGFCSPTSQPKQNITITPSFLVSKSPENSVKPSDCSPTPAPSPSSASPAQSPSISPSPTPSPPLFTIRSASGGHVKRGTTITVTPKKPAARGGGLTGPTTASTAAGSTPAKTPLQQAQMIPAVSDSKKRYPTAEEIEVIGGYQNLEKSCLVKNRGIPKKKKVCFDEDQLEQVCEYPSETSMLAGTPYPHDVGRAEKLQAEEAQDEDAEEEESILSIIPRSTRISGIATGRDLRVDESCPR